MTIQITVPRLPAGASSNIVGLAGLLAVVLAVGGLVGVWWAVLAAGIVTTTLAAFAQMSAEAGQQSQPAAPPKPYAMPSPAER